MSKNLLIVEADENDGDYVTSINYITNSQLAELLPIWKKMKAEDKKNKGEWSDTWEEKYPNLSEDELDIMRQFVPSGSQQECHTVVSITVYEVNSRKEYL